MTAHARLLEAVAQNRRRLWTICYRMTGSTADADDLTHDAVARAIERASELTGADPTGWLIRITANGCLDHLRRRKVRRRVTALCDGLDLEELAVGEPSNDPERATILRDDVRYAIIVALQQLSPRQRAALVLRDVCERSLEEVAIVLAASPNATKALIQRARVALARARHRVDADVPVDRAVVSRLAEVVSSGDLDALAALLAEDAWGIADGGGMVPAATKPSFGRRSIVRRFANTWKQLGGAQLVGELRPWNGELAVIVRVAAQPALVIAAIHVETRAGLIAALRIDRHPDRLMRFRAAPDRDRFAAGGGS